MYSLIAIFETNSKSISILRPYVTNQLQTVLSFFDLQDIVFFFIRTFKTV